MILLDTDVLVDCLRGLPAADRWLYESSDRVFGIPGIAAMELVVGCRDRADLRRVQRLMRRFQVVWPKASEFRRAFDLLGAIGLSLALRLPTVSSLPWRWNESWRSVRSTSSIIRRSAIWR